MALSRWSHSLWYIYESDEGLSICKEGSVSTAELISNVDLAVSSICGNKNYISKYDRFELKLFFINFRDLHLKKITFKEYVAKLNKLRRLGSNRFYCKYRILPNRWENKPIPPNEKVIVQSLGKKDRLYLYKNNLVYVKLKNSTFEYTQCGVKTVKSLRVFKPYFNDNPIIEGYSYILNLKTKLIYNNEINSEEGASSKIKFLKDRILRDRQEYKKLKVKYGI